MLAVLDSYHRSGSHVWVLPCLTIYATPSVRAFCNDVTCFHHSVNLSSFCLMWKFSVRCVCSRARGFHQIGKRDLTTHWKRWKDELRKVWMVLLCFIRFWWITFFLTSLFQFKAFCKGSSSIFSCMTHNINGLNYFISISRRN